GQGAYSQRDLLVNQAFNEPGIFNRAYTMINAADLEQIQCLPDIIRRALFTRMSDGQEPVSTGLGKDPFELAGRMAELRTIKPNGKESVPIGQRLSERLESIVLS